MKRLNLFVCAALAIAGAASCDQVVPETEDNTLRISAAYTSDAAYGHGTQGWIESDKVGMFAVSDGQTVATNVLYTPSQVADPNDPFSSVNEVELITNAPAMKLPHGFNEIYLYTPYVEGLTELTAVPLPDITVQNYVSGLYRPDPVYTMAYNKAVTCDCGIVRAGQMTPAYTQMTIPSPEFPKSFVGKKVTKVTVAAQSSWTKIAYKSATIDITTGKVDGELTGSIELVLPEEGMEISDGYFGASIETLYLILSEGVGISTTFVFTFTIDGQDYVMEAKPSEMMSTEANLNMYGQLKYELPSEEETPTPEA